MAASLLLALALQSTTAPPLNPNLQPLAFLVGSCWRGAFPDGRQTDTHCFTPIYGGAFIRDRHVVENGLRAYSGETLYRWDSGARQIRFDYYASDGSHSAGIAVPAAAGLTFPETHRAANGTVSEIRTAWARDGGDAYLVTSDMETNGTRRELLRMRMVRVGPAAD